MQLAAKWPLIMRSSQTLDNTYWVLKIFFLLNYWCVSMWALRAFWYLKVWGQTEHCSNLSWLWVRMWAWKRLLSENCTLQNLHRSDLSSAWVHPSLKWRRGRVCIGAVMSSPWSGLGGACGGHWSEQIVRDSGGIHRAFLQCVCVYVSLGDLSCRWSRSSRCSDAAWSLCWVLLCVLWILPDLLQQVSLCSLLPVEDFWRWSFTLWQWSTLSKLLMRTSCASGLCESCCYMIDFNL